MLCAADLNAEHVMSVPDPCARPSDTYSTSYFLLPNEVGSA